MSENVQSVARAAKLLKILAQGGWGMGVTEIAQAAGLGKSTTHRLLASLMAAEFVRLEPKSHRYTLGSGLLQLTETWFSEIRLRAVALPHLRQLRARTSETISLNLRDGHSRVAVERLDTSHEVRFVVELGRALPLHVGATGKAILAFLPETEKEDVLKAVSQDAGTPGAQILHELSRIRKAGTAYSSGERVPGSRSVSAPVFDHEGTVVASVSVLSLESRLDDLKVAEFRSLVMQTAKDISAELGLTP